MLMLMLMILAITMKRTMRLRLRRRRRRRRRNGMMASTPIPTLTAHMGKAGEENPAGADSPKADPENLTPPDRVGDRNRDMAMPMVHSLPPLFLPIRSETRFRVAAISLAWSLLAE